MQSNSPYVRFLTVLVALLTAGTLMLCVAASGQVTCYTVIDITWGAISHQTAHYEYQIVYIDEYRNLPNRTTVPWPSIPHITIPDSAQGGENHGSYTITNYKGNCLEWNTTYAISIRARVGTVTSPSTGPTGVRTHPRPKVSLGVSDSSHTVTEGSSVSMTVTVTLAEHQVLGYDMVLPLRALVPRVLVDGVEEPHYTAAETGDYTLPASVTIDAGDTTASFTVTANQDTDIDDEFLRVAFGGLPDYALPDPHATWYGLTIRDNDTTRPTNYPPIVSLSNSLHTVAEGSSASMTATMSRAVTRNVVVPLKAVIPPSTRSAETGDYTLPASVTITAGQTSAMFTVTANQDADQDDEYLIVSLGQHRTNVWWPSKDTWAGFEITDDDEGGAGGEGNEDLVEGFSPQQPPDAVDSVNVVHNGNSLDVS